MTLNIQALSSNGLKELFKLGSVELYLKIIIPFTFVLCFKQVNHINEEIFSLKVRLAEIFVLKTLVRNKALFLKGENQELGCNNQSVAA